MAADFRSSLRRHYYVTPKNYLDFIANYREQLKLNVKKIAVAVKRLDAGLTKLVEAATAVDAMSKELQTAKVIVDAKTLDVEALIKVIEEKTVVAEASEKEATIKKGEAEEQAVIIKAAKEDADASLMEALPAVEAAAAALDNIRKEDLQELKAFTNPPEMVKLVCLMCTCLRPTGDKLEETWGDAKKMLGDSKLLDKLKLYKKDNIKDAWYKAARKYMDKNKDLTVENMASKSKAGQGLLIWVEAIMSYHVIAKKVEPLRNQVKTMEKEQAKTEAALAELNAKLSQLNGELSELNDGYSKANTELTDLQMKASSMEKKLKAASKLIEGLTGERSRWSHDIDDLNAGNGQLVGDCLVNSSFLSYTGAFTAEYREKLLYTTLKTDLITRKVPISETYKVESLLTTDVTVQGWNAMGLPADEHSMQNGILTTSGSR